MMDCNHGNTNLRIGGTMRCPDCEFFVWKAKNGHLYIVPQFRTGIDGIELHPATNHHEIAEFLGGFIKRTRLNIDLDGLKPGEGLPKAVNSNRMKQERFEAIKNAIEPYGLMLTRLVKNETLEKNEPIWIHRCDLNPHDEIPHLNVPETSESEHESEQGDDPRFATEWMARIEAGNIMAPDRLYRNWRPGQREAVESVLQKRRSMSIVSLPTGRGKSFIAQYCAKLLRHTEGADQGPTLIVSPLISLMDDQRLRWNQINDDWRRAGLDPLRCAFLTSEETRRPQELKQQLRDGALDVLCCSPEVLLRPSKGRVQWIEIFQKMEQPFSLMVIDEAHTIADWGASIRPEFQLLNTIKRVLVRKNPACRLLLMSATITQDEEIELNRMFHDGMQVLATTREGGQSGKRGRSSNTRPDLMFDIEFIPSRNEEQVQEALATSANTFQRIKDDFGGKQNWWRDALGNAYNETPFSSVLFTRRRKDAKKPARNCHSSIHSNLTGPVQTYTGETSSVDRQNRLSAFLNDRISCLVATSAFGMGVDKPNAWLVGYLGLPFTLKSLYQSFGRAARDSGWPPQISETYRSGICFGRIFGRPMAFSPEMQIKLSLERYWDFIQLHAHQDGYMFLDVEQEAGLGWTTAPDSTTTLNFEFGEDALQNEYGWAGTRTFESNQALKQAERIWRKERRSRDAQIHFRMWLLSVLERAGGSSIVGVLRKGGQLQTFKSSISQGASEREAFHAASQVEGHPPSKLVLVTRIETEVKGYDDVVHLLENGIEILKHRHDRGLNEIKHFRKELSNPSACRRQLLAPAIGVQSEHEMSCIEAFESGIFLMPCNACRRHPVMQGLGLPQEGPLISTFEVVKLLRDGEKMSELAKEERFIQPMRGIYSPGDEVELLQPVAISGNIILVEPDKSERKARVVDEGRKMILDELPDESWSVTQGKFYCNKRGRRFMAQEEY